MLEDGALEFFLLHLTPLLVERRSDTASRARLASSMTSMALSGRNRGR
jgi:hypothetical protein